MSIIITPFQALWVLTYRSPGYCTFLGETHIFSEYRHDYIHSNRLSPLIPKVAKFPKTDQIRPSYGSFCIFEKFRNYIKYCNSVKSTLIFKILLFLELAHQELSNEYNHDPALSALTYHVPGGTVVFVVRPTFFGIRAWLYSFESSQ